MIRRFILLLIVFCQFPVMAQMTLEQLQTQSNQYPVIRADFEQSKQISGLKQPLISSGKVIISQQDGLWWQQNKPFALTLLLTNNQMVQTVANQPKQVITAESNPQLFQFNHLLTAMFKADREILEKNFTLSLDTTNQGWQLTLVPKTTPLDKLFRQIRLTGSQFLESIEMDDQQNDKTVIRFSNHQVKPTQLSQDEQRNFQP